MKYAVIVFAFLAGCAVTPEPIIEPAYTSPLPARILVLDADSGQPVPTAEIELVLRVVEIYTSLEGFEETKMTFRQVHLGYTGKDGAFILSASHAASGNYTGLLVTAGDYKPAFFEIAEDGRITFGHGSAHSYDALPEEMTVSLKKLTGRRELAYHHMTPIVKRWEEEGIISYDTWRRSAEQKARMHYELQQAKKQREKFMPNE
jgi:hypothetical protein